MATLTLSRPVNLPAELAERIEAERRRRAVADPASQAKAPPRGKRTAPAETTPPPVHQPASPEIVAENQRREAEWLAARAEAVLADAAARAAVAALEATLRGLAPLVVTDPPVPLAIGIHRDIAALLTGEADKATISRFLRRWTRRVEYVRLVAAGTVRRDLDGRPTSEPSRAECESAAEWLASRGTA